MERKEYETALQIIDKYPEDLDMLVLGVQTPMKQNTDEETRKRHKKIKAMTEKVLELDPNNVSALIKYASEIIELENITVECSNDEQYEEFMLQLKEKIEQRNLITAPLIEYVQKINPKNPKLGLISAFNAYNKTIDGMVTPEFLEICETTLAKFEKFFGYEEWKDNFNNLRGSYEEFVNLFINKIIWNIDQSLGATGIIIDNEQVQSRNQKRINYNKRIYNLTKKMIVELLKYELIEQKSMNFLISPTTPFEENKNKPKIKLMGDGLEILAATTYEFDRDLTIEHSRQAQEYWLAQEEFGLYLRAKLWEVKVLFRERPFDKRFFHQLTNYENEVTEMFDDRNSTALVDIARMGLIYATRTGDQEKFDEYKDKLMSLENIDYFTSLIDVSKIIMWGIEHFNHEGYNG